MDTDTIGFIVVSGSERMEEATWREINPHITERWERERERERPYGDTLDGKISNRARDESRRATLRL